MNSYGYLFMGRKQETTWMNILQQITTIYRVQRYIYPFPTNITLKVYMDRIFCKNFVPFYDKKPGNRDEKPYQWKLVNYSGKKMLSVVTNITLQWLWNNKKNEWLLTTLSLTFYLRKCILAGLF